MHGCVLWRWPEKNGYSVLCQRGKAVGCRPPYTCLGTPGHFPPPSGTQYSSKASPSRRSKAVARRAHFLTGEISKSAQIQCGPIHFVFLLLFRICLHHTAGFDKILFEKALKSICQPCLFSDCFVRYKARYTEDLSTFISIFQRPKGPSGFCRRGLPCLSAVRSPFDRMIVVAPADRRHAIRQRLIGRGRHLTAVQIDHEIVPVDQAVFVRRVVVATEHQIAQ